MKSPKTIIGKRRGGEPQHERNTSSNVRCARLRLLAFQPAAIVTHQSKAKGARTNSQGEVWSEEQSCTAAISMGRMLLQVCRFRGIIEKPFRLLDGREAGCLRVISSLLRDCCASWPPTLHACAASAAGRKKSSAAKLACTALTLARWSAVSGTCRSAPWKPSRAPWMSLLSICSPKERLQGANEYLK